MKESREGEETKMLIMTKRCEDQDFLLCTHGVADEAHCPTCHPQPLFQRCVEEMEEKELKIEGNPSIERVADLLCMWASSPPYITTYFVLHGVRLEATIPITNGGPNDTRSGIVRHYQRQMSTRRHNFDDPYLRGVCCLCGSSNAGSLCIQKSRSEIISEREAMIARSMDLASTKSVVVPSPISTEYRGFFTKSSPSPIPSTSWALMGGPQKG